MPDEPKRRIEAHLEAHAAQRREASGGAFELHDLARARLLAEVRASVPIPTESGGSSTDTASENTPEPSGPSAWRLLWTRLAVCFGSVALLAVATFAVRMSIPTKSREDSLAKLAPASPEAVSGARAEQEKHLAAMPAAASISNVVRSRGDDAKLDERRTMSVDARGSLPAPAAVVVTTVPRETAPASPIGGPAASSEPASTSALAMTSSKREVIAAAAEPPPETKPTAAPPATPPPPTEAPAPEPLPPPPKGSFIRRDVHTGMRRNLLSPPRPDIMASFRVVKQGDTVLIIDADGSVYTGSTVGEPDERRFAVSGINLMLGRNIVVDASAELDNSTDPSTGETNRLAIVRGRITLGRERWWEFEAVK